MHRQLEQQQVCLVEEGVPQSWQVPERWEALLQLRAPAGFKAVQSFTVTMEIWKFLNTISMRSAQDGRGEGEVGRQVQQQQQQFTMVFYIHIIENRRYVTAAFTAAICIWVNPSRLSMLLDFFIRSRVHFKCAWFTLHMPHQPIWHMSSSGKYYESSCKNIEKNLFQISEPSSEI